jgi:hypothetical protein
MRPAGTATPPRLPYHTPLFSDEALISWIWRLAGLFEISARHLLQGAFGIRQIDKESVRHGTWWRTPEQRFVAELSRRTGIADARLWETTLANWSAASPGGEQGWGPAGRKFMGGAMARCQSAANRDPSYCLI